MCLAWGSGALTSGRCRYFFTTRMLIQYWMVCQLVGSEGCWVPTAKRHNWNKTTILMLGSNNWTQSCELGQTPVISIADQTLLYCWAKPPSSSRWTVHIWIISLGASGPNCWMRPCLGVTPHQKVKKLGGGRMHPILLAEYILIVHRYIFACICAEFVYVFKHVNIWHVYHKYKYTNAHLYGIVSIDIYLNITHLITCTVILD